MLYDLQHSKAIACHGVEESETKTRVTPTDYCSGDTLTRTEELASLIRGTTVFT